MTRSHFFIFIRKNTIVTKAGFSTKFVESISSGCPVLTNESSNIDEYLVEGKNGFFLNINDEKILSSQINRILNMDNTEVVKMKKYCRNSKLFNYENYLQSAKYFFDNL